MLSVGAVDDDFGAFMFAMITPILLVGAAASGVFTRSIAAAEFLRAFST